MSDLGLQNKRVIITGAGGGLGRGIAEAFFARGAQVMAADINQDGAEETAEMLGKGVFATTLDVTSRESCVDCVRKAKEKMGGVDVLINNAALYGGLERRLFEDIDETVWDDVMSVNVKGVWQMSRAAAPELRQSKSGAIVNVASATVFSGSPEWLHYVASKGAVIAMSRVMAKELGPDNVRVNVLAPGVTMTEASHGHFEDAQSYGAGRAALKRNAEIEDITGGALYLASDLSTFMTGQTLIVDGGKQFI